MTIRLYGNSHYNPKPNVASLQADMATHSMLPCINKTPTAASMLPFKR
jgi:hypothetical protein